MQSPLSWLTCLLHSTAPADGCAVTTPGSPGRDDIPETRLLLFCSKAWREGRAYEAEAAFVCRKGFTRCAGPGEFIRVAWLQFVPGWKAPGLGNGNSWWQGRFLAEEGGRVAAFPWLKGQLREWAAPQMFMRWLLVSNMSKGVSVLRTEWIWEMPSWYSRGEMDSVPCLLSRLCKWGCLWWGNGMEEAEFSSAWSVVTKRGW